MKKKKNPKPNPKAIWQELITAVERNAEVMAEKDADMLVDILQRAMHNNVIISKTDDGKYIVKGDDIRRLGAWEKKHVKTLLHQIEQDDRQTAIYAAAWGEARYCIYNYDDSSIHDRLWSATLAMSIQRMAATTDRYPTRECEIIVRNTNLILRDTVAWDIQAPPEETITIIL